jgi:calcineurin-like phosphoesterase family protein
VTLNINILGDTLHEEYSKWLTQETFLEYKQRRGHRVRHPETWVRLFEQYPQLCLNHFETEIWVSSDHHFGHKNIIKYSDRPFTDNDEMHQEMIDRHNAVVGPDDTWICVGDFAFMPDEQANEIISSMNGRHKILVVGNHDIRRGGIKQLEFDHICTTAYYEHTSAAVDGGLLPLLFTHYPYPDLPPTMINIHGHEHVARLATQDPMHINVNVELHEFGPVRFAELLTQAESRRISLDDESINPICE